MKVSGRRTKSATGGGSHEAATGLLTGCGGAWASGWCWPLVASAIMCMCLTRNALGGLSGLPTLVGKISRQGMGGRVAAILSQKGFGAPHGAGSCVSLQARRQLSP